MGTARWVGRMVGRRGRGKVVKRVSFAPVPVAVPASMSAIGRGGGGFGG